MQRLSRLLAALLVLTGVFVFPASSVGAQTDACDDLIDLLGVDDPDGLRAEIAEAEAETGIDFHVFATDSLAAGQDLDAASFANCSGAYIVPGEVADDTVVLAVAVESRDFNVVYGENLKGRLDDDVDAIFDRMAAWFQNEDFGRGLQAGVDEAAAGLATEPSNAAGWVVGGVGLAAAAAGGGVAVSAVRRKNKREQEAAAAEYDKASSAVTAVQARWYDAEQTASFLAGRLTGSSMGRLETAQNEAAEASRRLYDAWSPVSELDGTTVAEFDDESRTEAFRHVQIADAIAKENAEALQKFETTLSDLDGSVDEMAAMFTATSERIDAGRFAAENRQGEGWDVTTAKTRLDQLETALGHIDAFALRIDVDAMRPALTPLATEANSIATDLEGLDELRDATTARRTAVASEASGQLGRVGSAGTMIDGWKLTHAADSFDEVVGYPAEAAKQLERAQQHLADANAVGEIPRDVGVLRKVIADLDAADIAIDLADELLDEIDELDIELEAAAEGAPQAVADARSDADIFNNYVSANRLDLSPTAHEAARRIASDVDEAEAALRLAPPDYLLAIELAEDVGDDVDEQLAKAKATVAERERLRTAAQTQLRAAHTAIARADRHVDSHVFSGRQSKNAQAQINELRHEYNQLVANAASNPEQVIQRAREMTNVADQLYAEAQRRQRASRGGGVIIGGGGGFRSGGTHRRGGSRRSTRSTSRSRPTRRSSPRRSGGRRGKF